MVVKETFRDYETTVSRCMEAGGAAKLFGNGRPVMLKPNLINASPYPVTTPPAFCEAVIGFIREHTQAPIVIADGCGDPSLNTAEVFDQLGYGDLAARQGAALLDLNTATSVRCTDTGCRLYPEMWLPKAVFEHVLISLPVLKAHSLARLTGSMKNMMGLAPPDHYGGSWKKAVLHQHLDEAIAALNHYRGPDFTVMDATLGLADYHLGGACCDPPTNCILAGPDARAVDREAAALLGMEWKSIGHLQ